MSFTTIILIVDNLCYLCKAKSEKLFLTQLSVFIRSSGSCPLQNFDSITKPEMAYLLSLLSNTQWTNGSKSDYSVGGIQGHRTSFHLLMIGRWQTLRISRISEIWAAPEFKIASKDFEDKMRFYYVNLYAGSGSY